MLFFCRFVLVLGAFCSFLAVPLVRFSTLFSPCLSFFFNCGGVYLGGVFGGGRNNVLSLAFYLTPLF